MKKPLIVISFLLVLVGIGVKTISQIPRQESERRTTELEEREKRDSLTIKERVELAKIRGKKQIVAPGFVSLHPVAATPEEIEQLLPRYTIVLAESVEEFGYLIDPRTIMSWYRFRIIDVLSQAPPQQTFAVRQVPDQLLPIKEDELLVPTAGGSATLDGGRNYSKRPDYSSLQEIKEISFTVIAQPLYKNCRTSVSCRLVGIIR